MTQFYYAANNTALSNGWTHATKVYPESEEIIYDCPACGIFGRHPKGKFSIDLEGGTKFPDVLLCGSYPLFIVAEKVINDWRTDGVTGFEFHEVTVNSLNSKKIQKINIPQYYHIVIKGRCMLDLNRMEVKISKKCEKCNQVSFDKPSWKIGKFFIDETTWDGSDLFVSELFPTKVLVTEKVVNSACKNKHTNFRFIKAEESMKVITQAIDYLKFCK